MNELKEIKIVISSLPKNGWWKNGIIAYHDNDMMSNGAMPNQELLKKEHENLIDKLHEHSLKTISIAFKTRTRNKQKKRLSFLCEITFCVILIKIL